MVLVFNLLTLEGEAQSGVSFVFAQYVLDILSCGDGARVGVMPVPRSLAIWMMRNEDFAPTSDFSITSVLKNFYQPTLGSNFTGNQE